MTYRWVKPQTHCTTLWDDSIWKDTIYEITLAFISIHSTSEYGGVPLHLKCTCCDVAICWAFCENFIFNSKKGLIIFSFFHKFFGNTYNNTWLYLSKGKKTFSTRAQIKLIFQDNYYLFRLSSNITFCTSHELYSTNAT